MCIPSFYVMAKDFSSPLITAFAAGIAAYITYSLQKRLLYIASNKLRLDLFEKRYAIFQEAKNLLVYVSNKGFRPEEINHEKIRNYYISIDEGRFLLSKPTVDFLSECHEACEDLLMHVTKHANDDLIDNNFAEIAASQNARVRRLYADLPEQFQRDLTIAV